MQRTFTVIILLILGVAAGYGIGRWQRAAPASPAATEEQQSAQSNTDASAPTQPQGTSSGATPPVVSKVNIFLIAPDDKGETGKLVGCGDSVIAVERTITPTQAPLAAALKELLALKVQYYGQSGLYNALHTSDLSLKSVAITDGVATIRLVGTLTVGGVCDNPRVEAQLKEIALQFATVQHVTFFINDVPLEKILSGKG